jgi:phage terminase small subunit
LCGRTPQLNVVPAAPTPYAPPPVGLGKPGTALWHRLMNEYLIEDASSLEMLEHACSATDRLVEISESIAQEGLLVQTRAGVRDNPLLKQELSYRSFITRVLARLGLEPEPTKPVGRPPATRWEGPRALRTRT